MTKVKTILVKAPKVKSEQVKPVKTPKYKAAEVKAGQVKSPHVKAAPVTPWNLQGKKTSKGINVEQNMIPNNDEENYNGYSTQQVKTPKDKAAQVKTPKGKIRRHSRQLKVILATPCIIILVNQL